MTGRMGDGLFLVLCGVAGFLAARAIPVAAPSSAVERDAPCPQARDVEHVRQLAHQLEVRAQDAEHRFDVLWGAPPASPVPPEVAYPYLEALAAVIEADAVEIQCYDEVCVASYGFRNGGEEEHSATQEALRDAGFRYAHVSSSSSPETGDSWVDVVLVDAPQTHQQEVRGSRLTGRMASSRSVIP